MLLNNQFAYNAATGTGIFVDLGTNATVTSIKNLVEPMGKEQAIAYLNTLVAMQVLKIAATEEDGSRIYEVIPDPEE